MLTARMVIFNSQLSMFNSTRRELRRLTSRRLYFVAAVVLPLFLLLFMCTIFGSGQMRHLRLWRYCMCLA